MAATATRKKVGRPALGSQSPLLGMGEAHKAGNGWTVVLATIELFISITEKMIDKATSGSPRYCVVGLALEALFGKRYDFQVGTSFTKVWDREQKIEVRFKTPASLAARIRAFDKTKRWNLPANLYKLSPIPADYRSGLTNTLNVISYHAKKGKNKAAASIKTIVKGTKKSGAKKKKRAAATRTVLRNTRIQWTPPVLA